MRIPGAGLAASKFLKLWPLKSYVARLRPGTPPTTKTDMKAINVQLPVLLTKSILLARAGPARVVGHLRLLIESGGLQFGSAFFRSLRAVLSGVLDGSAYDQISLGREVFVAFTSQGPVVYRFGCNNAGDVSVTRETNARAR